MKGEECEGGRRRREKRGRIVRWGWGGGIMYANQ